MNATTNGNGNGEQSVELTVDQKFAAIEARTDYPFAFECPNPCFGKAGHGRIMAGEGRASRPFTSVEEAMRLVNDGVERGYIAQTDVEKLTREIEAIPNLAKTEAEFFATQLEQEDDGDPIGGLLAMLGGGPGGASVIRL